MERTQPNRGVWRNMERTQPNRGVEVYGTYTTQ